MHASRSPNRSTVRSLALLAAAGLVALAGCRGDSAAKVDWSKVPICANNARPVQLSVAPRRTIVVGFDQAEAYPDWLRQDAQVNIADMTESLVKPGSGAEVYVQFINHQAYGPGAGRRLAVPKIQAPEYRRLPQDNPLYTVEQRQEYEKQVQAWCDEVEKANSKYDQELRAAAASVRDPSEELRTARVGPDPERSLPGFFARASELLRKAPPGTMKLLILYSDLEPGPPERLPDLAKVRVAVSLYAEDPARAENLRLELEASFKAAGAVEVLWYLPGEEMREVLR